jgi:hypothetical protein
MDSFSDLGKILIVVGIVITVAGVLVVTGGKLPWLGRLPGDFTIRGENYTIYLPLATSVLISIVLSLIYWFFRRIIA